MMRKNKILISTGGTGGHVFPAYSLAEHLIKKKKSVKISTDIRGFKFLKKYLNLELKIINSASIFVKNPVTLIISIFKILRAIVTSLIFLSRYKPNIVFGMGGYASFPVCIASKILNIPFIIYENNLFLGKTNRFLLPFAYKMFISYGEVQGINQKYQKKIFKVGNLIRNNILNFNKSDLENSEKNISVLILGGSQAAKVFGETLPNIFEKCLLNKINLKIYQQCLTEQKIELEKKYSSLSLDYELFSFSENLIKYFDLADFVITRSGSSITAELLNCRVPFVCIPYPFAADDHQLLNAKYFEKIGCGFLIEEKYMDIKLFELINSIHKDRNILKLIQNKQKIYSDKNTVNLIDKQIEDLLND